METLDPHELQCNIKTEPDYYTVLGTLVYKWMIVMMTTIMNIIISRHNHYHYADDVPSASLCGLVTSVQMVHTEPSLS